MSTSLAEQLQRLAVPQTTTLLRRDKKRPSLLFDPKEAANLDKETFYQIGIDGLEELKKRDSIFAQFENTLFHITSKDFERSVESAESNQRLNKNIRKFLITLSPYFLFNCSYKALEWLVYRYYIHEYNKEDLLMLILPYHETNIFVRALQLLNLKEPNDKWNWLKPLQRPGIHLPKQTLYNHAASDPYFLQFVSNFVLGIIREYDKPTTLTVVFNFYCTTFTGALEYSREVNEAQVSQMLPVILKGLTSDIPDFAAASYVITAKLLTKIQLSDKILEKLVQKLTQVNVPSLTSEAALVLVVLFQSQKHFDRISDGAIKNLCRREGFSKILEKLNKENIYIYPLLGPLLHGGVSMIVNTEDNQAYINFVDEVVAEVKIDDGFIHSLLNSVLDIYQKEESPEKCIPWLKQFINKVERQHPVSFDMAIKTIMTTSNDPSKIHQQKALRKLIQNITNSYDCYELFEKLYHPNSNLRIEGLKMLRRKIKIFKEKDFEMLQNALFARLDDDNVEVVSETLCLFKLKFPEVVNMNEFKDVLIKTLHKCQSVPAWWKVSSSALSVLCTYFSDSDVKIFLVLLPFLLPTTEPGLQAAKQILSSEFAQKSKMLQPLREELMHTSDCDQFSTIIYNNLEGGKNLPDIKLLVKALKDTLEENSTVLQKYLAMLLLRSCLPSTCEVEVSNLVLDIFETYLNTSKLIVVKSEAKVLDYVSLAKRNKFTLQSYLYCVEGLIFKTVVPDKIGLVDFSSENVFYLRLLNILIKGCRSTKHKKSSVYSNTLNKFWYFCNNKVMTIIELLLNISICENDFINDEFRVGCLHILWQILKNERKNLTASVSYDQSIIPYILVGFSFPNEELRKNLLNIAEFLLKNCEVSPCNYTKLLNKLKKYREEITLDQEQVSIAIANILPSDESFKSTLSILVTSTNNPKYPLYLKSGLMTLLTHLNNIDIFTETSKVATNILQNKPEKLNELESKIVCHNIVRFDSSIAEGITENSLIWEFIKLIVQNDSTVIKNKTKSLTPAGMMLAQVDRELFSKLNLKIQESFLDFIVTIATTSQNPEVLQSAGHVFKRIDLDTALVLKQIEKMRDIQSAKLDITKRKRRVDIIPTADILDMLEWKKGVTILEFLQDKKKIRNTNLLLSVLFEVLKKCLDFDEQASVEYTKQLLLSTILHCCDKIENDESLPKNSFNMQLVVQCIRASQNPQTHHHALLLLAKTATLIPKQVLHHIIAIFTFVGSSVLRHDDAYSFQIITKIIDTIIPILIQDGETNSIETVLRVFVDAILDIPEHRRMPLFKQLLGNLNPKENLHLFLLIVFEAHIVHGHMEKQKTNKNRSLANIDEVPKRLDIAADLCREFSPETVFGTCIKILQYLRTLPKEKSDHTDDEEFLFDIKRYTPKQFRHYKYTIITFIANLLTSTQFIEKVAKFSDEEMLQLEGLFKDMIINILNYVQETSKVAEKNSNTPQSQYWKVVLHYSYDILDAINALLTSKMFLLVIRGLMVYSLSAVRKRALELLTNKLQSSSGFFNECDKSELYDLIVSSLITIIKTIERPDVEPEQELIVQKALISLKLIVRHMAPEDPDKFSQILEFIADLVKTAGKLNENTLASLILCLAELCSTLKAHAISTLNKFMPVLIKILKSQKRLEVPNLLLISNITALHKILDSLPLFLSPYMEKLLYEICSLACKWNNQTDDQKLTPFIAKLRSIQQKIGSVIPLRVLLPAIENSYNNLVNKSNYPAIGPLMAILSECLAQLKGSELQANISELTTFFLNALQFRAEAQSTHQEALEVETHVIKAFVSLILKLSESSFRPLYYKLFDWAVRTDARTKRIITFYNLSYAFANCLKGLFVLFAGHCINNAATLLEACNSVRNKELYFEEDIENVALLEYILKTLHAIFLYANQKFVTKERFEVLMQPLVDQLENTLGGIESLENRAKTILTPCLVQFAVATADDALWKQMNYQILLKMRHNCSNIRLVALESLSETAKKLGEDFLPLLPETIPFLAELLEDEEENVEKTCQKTVQELEKVLGEPLQKYF